MSVLVYPHAIKRYLERAMHHASTEEVERLLADCVITARARQKRGRDMRTKRVRMIHGRLAKFFYLKFVTPSKRRVYLAVDEQLTRVYTVLTLDMFKNGQRGPDTIGPGASHED